MRIFCGFLEVGFVFKYKNDSLFVTISIQNAVNFFLNYVLLLFYLFLRPWVYSVFGAHFAMEIIRLQSISNAKSVGIDASGLLAT